MLKKILFFCLLINSLSVCAVDIPAQLLLEKILKNTTSLSAQFNQNLVDQYGYLLQKSTGSLNMQRPGKFRWDYILPYPQNIISNGEKIWMYDSELEQVNVRPYNQVLASSPINLLDKKQKLNIEFNLESMPESEGQIWLKLIPKNKDNDFQEMQVGIKDGKIKTMRFLDAFQQQTEISFSQLVVNPAFNHQHFEFTIPKGADVMGDF